MFKLPVCPHCGTIYRYKDTKEAIKKKDNVCYHCNKKFRAGIFPGMIVGAILPLIACIAINIFLLTRMKEFQILPLIAVTLIFILIIYLIIPFFTKFRKTDDIKENKDSSKKRRNKLG